MAGNRRLSRCPAGCNSGQIPKQVQAQRKVTDKDGNTHTETYTETVNVDCGTCDGSGQVADFDADMKPRRLNIKTFCHDCKGTGSVYRPRAYSDSDGVRGTMTQTITCLTCTGKQTFPGVQPPV